MIKYLLLREHRKNKAIAAGIVPLSKGRPKKSGDISVQSNIGGLIMDKFDQLSFRQIKYDMEVLKKITFFLNKKKYAPIFSLGMTPFLSLMINEAIIFSDKFDRKTKLPANHFFSIKDIRLKTKLFDDKKISRSKKAINNIDYIQDYEFKQLMLSESMRTLNMNYNLGIYLDNENQIIGNTQLYYYFFQPESIKKQSPEEVIESCRNNEFNSIEKLKTLCLGYGEYLGKTCNYFCKFLSKIPVDHCVKLQDLNYDLYFQDFNTSRDIKIFTNNPNIKTIKLYLLHLLGTINFVRLIVNKIIVEDFSFSLRIEYIACYYAVNSLSKVHNSIIELDMNTTQVEKDYNTIEDDIDKSNLFNQNFRNCMMHYGLKTDDENHYPIIEPQYLDYDKPLWGLVESCYDGISYSELKIKIEDKLDIMADVIKKWLDIEFDAEVL